MARHNIDIGWFCKTPDDSVLFLFFKFIIPVIAALLLIYASTISLLRCLCCPKFITTWTAHTHRGHLSKFLPIQTPSELYCERVFVHFGVYQGFYYLSHYINTDYFLPLALNFELNS